MFEFITVKFFENGDLIGSSKLQDIIFEQEREIVTVQIVLSRSDVPVEPEPVILHEEPVVDQRTKPITEIPLKRSHHVRRPIILDDYVFSMRMTLT